jgi:Reverse transcriptase (RNA-dependent DNA polymerase)
MSQELADALNLDLAWSRLLFDRPDRSFVSHPFQIDLLEFDLPAWLESIRRRIVEGYISSPCVVVQSPKGNWQVRPGASLALDDEVVFNALVGRYLDNIRNELRDAQGDPDVAYQLGTGVNRREWVKRGFPVWKQFREKSNERLANGAAYVLFADISAFYENIALPRLASDLRRIGMDHETANLLSDCLNRWAQPRAKGIPQGYTAADILAKIHLASVDTNLRNEGFDHLRYVDDIRVFCQTRQEGQRALLLLTDLLRARGLNVQSAKTFIYEAAEATRKIDGVGPIIADLHNELLVEIRQQFVDGGYGTVSDLARLTAEDPEHPPLEVLERAFAEYFRQGIHEFDKTLFHYLLTRLGATESRIAVGYCLNALRERPEETGDILRHFRKVGLTEAEHGRLAVFLRGDDSIYDYQNYLILKFYFEAGLDDAGIVAVSRRYIRDVNLPPWLRAYATAIVGAHGDPADMEYLEARYPECREVGIRLTHQAAIPSMRGWKTILGT